MIKLNGNNYNLVFLDTNMMRFVARNTNGSGKEFFNKFFIDDKSNIPCFSIHNVFELKNYQDIYDDFVNVFNLIPCLVFFPYKTILDYEIDCYKKQIRPIVCNKIAYATSPNDTVNQPKLSNYLNKIWNDKKIMTLLRITINELGPIARAWENQRINISELKSLPGLSIKQFTPKHYQYFEEQTIIKDFVNHKYRLNGVDYERFPSIRTMEYSHFSRVHMTKKKIKPNDVMDIKIASAMPYIDKVITEKFQLDVLKKGCNFIDGLDIIEFLSVSDFSSKGE